MVLNGYKTYLAAIAAVLIAAGVTIKAYVEGQPLELEVLVTACVALAILFLRKSQSEKK